MIRIQESFCHRAWAQMSYYLGCADVPALHGAQHVAPLAQGRPTSVHLRAAATSVFRNPRVVRIAERCIDRQYPPRCGSIRNNMWPNDCMLWCDMHQK